MNFNDFIIEKITMNNCYSAENGGTKTSLDIKKLEEKCPKIQKEVGRNLIKYNGMNFIYGYRAKESGFAENVKDSGIDEGFYIQITNKKNEKYFCWIKIDEYKDKKIESENSTAEIINNNKTDCDNEGRLYEKLAEFIKDKSQENTQK